MKNRLVILVCIWGIAITCFSCTHDHAAQLYPSPGCAVDTNGMISFKKDIIPVLKTACALPGCHSGTNPAGNLNLDSAVAYAAITDSRGGYIDTAHPAASLFYSQLVSVNDPMPPTGKLDQCTTTLILKWIQQKASDN